MEKNYFATGSRKSATAKVWLVSGGSDTVVNGHPFEQYFGRADLVTMATSPLKATGTTGFGLKCQCVGGGLSAQAAAVALGAARALVAYNPDLRKTLRGAELLKRDPREKERMKYGLAKRRKRFQWTKR
jgi:small subunit ribosomal protein S9